MDHFSEQAPTYEEAVEQVRQKYGERAKIYARERRTTRGFLGFGRKELVLVSGYVMDDDPAETAGQDREGYDELLSEIRRMEQRLANQQHPKQTAGREPVLEELQLLLDNNDFSRDFIQSVTELVRTRLNPVQLADRQQVELFVLRLISETFRFDTANALHLPRRFGLVGPTGVGKTTTIAKIAARSALGHGSKKKRSVRMVTIDSFRIGAREQIRSFGDLMDIPVDTVETPQELENCLKEHEQADLILIDTIGKSPRDEDNLRDMQQILAVCGKETYWSLALAASTKQRDLDYALQRFEPFSYRSLVITKLDETDVIGNLVSSLHRSPKPMLYAATGQRVPTDLVVPKAELFLQRLKGFSVDLEHLSDGV